LQELLSYACRKQPQLLILVGPFNPLHETTHAYLKCSATVHTDQFSLFCRWDPLLTLIILT